MSRIAVVLFNLGGPDGPDAVRPFLRNLFADPAIIAGPAPLRLGLAELISRVREKSAKANYAVMGGGSPLNAETGAQATALQARLAQLRPGDEVKVFMAMRYWRPFTAETAAEVAAFAPDDVVLLPLYPQFSTTTTGSSYGAWSRAYQGGGRQHGVCCYFENAALADAHAALILDAWRAAGSPAKVRLLFSAHGLPEKIAVGGDPYQWQIERSCAKVAERLDASWDWRVCYQSRVGPMKWIGPSTIEEIERAGAEGLGVLIDPIAFVSEHVETLVELDRDYAEVARRAGAAPYIRVPALGTHPRFIDALAELTQTMLAGQLAGGGFGCAEGFSRCGRGRAEAA
ncbi:MAG TPA: ferrochelatase [Caulobacteraceae bacterium]|jgi:ferrochelatase|nr:ferrochelatase [Caulobacteraceae bacterium]